MRKLCAVALLGAVATVLGGCAALAACGLGPAAAGREAPCEPVYVSPCSPPPSQGLGYGGAPEAPLSACGGAGSVCGG